MAAVHDLYDIVDQWSTFMVQATGLPRDVPPSSITKQIDFERLTFDHESPKFTDRPNGDHPKKQVSIINKTDNFGLTEIVWTPQISETVTATAQLKLTKGMTMNQLPVISLNSGDIPAAFQRKLDFQHKSLAESTHTYTETKRIPVPPGHHAEVEFIVEEKEMTKRFSLVSHVSGQVRVTIRDGNGKFLQTMTSDIAEMVSNSNQKSCPWSVKNKAVTYESEGECVLRFAQETYSNVTMIPIQGYQ